ncbi:hypothetical protein [Burkholderia sp. LMG 13014]|uniref:hypothetical protein n=1 Tax=Burkholderia sp. LMG 13014 TaxID=2709306 RepID=UPI0019651810|nr:hypothetical protein [Burkholderia sp. LMG 13014]
MQRIALRGSARSLNPVRLRRVLSLRRLLRESNLAADARFGRDVWVVDADEPSVGRLTPANPALVHQRREPAPRGSVVGIGDACGLRADFAPVICGVRDSANEKPQATTAPTPLRPRQYRHRQFFYGNSQTP